MSGTDIHQLAAAYALDAIDERERAEFEAHYPTCTECRPEVKGFRETLSQVASSAAVDPPVSLKVDVMAKIGTTRQHSPLLPNSVIDLATHRRSRQRMVRAMSVAAAVILIGVGAFVVGRNTGGGSDYYARAAQVFEQPDARSTTLGGVGTGTFKVVWSARAGKAVVVGDGLVDPGAGKAYELWLIDGKGAHAVRLLDKAQDQQVHRVVDVNGSPTEWAITVEPEGGVDKATGDIIFSGAI